ncbi:MAG: hypothetical protein EXS52_00060 [Candidatus Staskawiczbacteria bacterium]|nr:hypothetical protein [Candidatus Staskawiczbacteria bacterium]
MKIPSALQKKVLIIIALVIILVPVFLFVGYRNREAINALYHFSSSNIYGEDVVLFYDNNCSHCIKVDDFIKNNDVEGKTAFVRLEISKDSLNATILEDKAQICGLDFQQIGVPFLWDGKDKKCIIGYVDIISFFREKITKK